MSAKKSIVIRVEIGRCRISESKMRHLTIGAVISLNTYAGSPLAIYADDKLIGYGEAVVFGDRYGVRIADIIAMD